MEGMPTPEKDKNYERVRTLVILVLFLIKQAFSILRNSSFSHSLVFGIEFATDIVSVEFPCDYSSCATSHKRVKHYAILGTTRKNARLD